MLKNNPVYIGAPNSIRDFIYVSDHVEAYLLTMERNTSKGEAYNVGSSLGISNYELAKKIAKIIGYNNEIKIGSYPPGYPIRPLTSDQPYLILDSKKIKNKIGWNQKISLEKGIKYTIDYWKNKLI